MTDITSPKPWDREPDEPVEWYDRFHIYMTLPSPRTLIAAYRKWTGNNGDPSSTAREMAARWRWKERAFQRDQANREEEAEREQARADEARERRLSVIEELTEGTTAALIKADLKNLSAEESRDRLPSLRQLLATLVELQRRELQHVPPPPPDEDIGLYLAERYEIANKILATYEI